MKMLRVCPQCHQILVPDAEQDTLFVCRPCGGIFQLPDSPPPSIVSVEPPGSGLACPGCLQPMLEEQVGETTQHACFSCGGHWGVSRAPGGTSADSGPDVAETAESMPRDAAASAFAATTLAQQLRYGLSLPERALRTLVGVSAGTMREAATFLVPQAFQDSVTYKVAIRNSLNFLTEHVGGFSQNSPSSEAADIAGTYLAKKTVGNFVELAGLMLLPVSPLWLLAAVSDLAYGSSTYVKELARELEMQGVIDGTSTIHGIDDLLEAIRNSSSKASDVFDQPPFSVQELQDVVDETRAAMASADLRKLIPETEVRRYWERLQQSARQENSSIWQVSTAVTMTTYRQLEMTAQGALTGLKVAQRLVDRNLLDHFRISLEKIENEGLLTIVGQVYEPYVSRVYDNFQSDRTTWTESALDPQTIRGVFRWAGRILTSAAGSESGPSDRQ